MSFKDFFARLAEPVTGMWSAPGSPLRLRKPPGFEPSDAFPGLYQPGGAASIMVQVIPAPYAELIGGFTGDALIGRGLQLASSEEREVAGRGATLLRIGQRAEGREFAKWILMVDLEGTTVIATATWPADGDAELDGQLRDTLLAAKLADDPTRAQGAGFRLGATPLLKEAPAWGGMSIYTPDGLFVPGKPGAALFLAGHGLRNLADDAARRAFATDHIGQVDQALAGLSITAQRPVAIAGLPGWETQAVGRERKGGEAKALWEILLFDEGRYVVLTGSSSEADAPTYVPAFQALAEGLRP